MSEFSSSTHPSVIANCANNFAQSAYKKSMENYSLYDKYHTRYLCNNDDFNNVSKYFPMFNTAYNGICNAHTIAVVARDITKDACTLIEHNHITDYHALHKIVENAFITAKSALAIVEASEVSAHAAYNILINDELIDIEKESNDIDFPSTDID